MNCATSYPVVEAESPVNQFVLAQALQISAIHARMDLEIALPGKGSPEISGIALIRAPKMGVGNYRRPADIAYLFGGLLLTRQ